MDCFHGERGCCRYYPERVLSIYCDAFSAFFPWLWEQFFGDGAGAHADDGWRRCAEAMRHSWGRAWPLAVFDRFGHEKVLFSEFSQKCLMFFA